MLQESSQASDDIRMGFVARRTITAVELDGWARRSLCHPDVQVFVLSCLKEDNIIASLHQAILSLNNFGAKLALKRQKFSLFTLSTQVLGIHGDNTQQETANLQVSYFVDDIPLGLCIQLGILFAVGYKL